MAAFWLTVVAVLFSSVGTAAAQQEAPLRLVFLNSDPMDGTAVYDSVANVLDASGDIDRIDQSDLLSAGDELGVSLETFRDGDRREQNASAFKQMLSQTSAESIMVLDVFGSGRTMQLVVIGPNGDELADVRQSIAANKPSQGESVEALRKVFKVLVPEVRQFREDEARRQEQQVQVALIDEPDPADQSIKERVVREHRQNHADLSAGVTPHVGVIFGRRKMAVDTQAEYQLDHVSPFIGVAGEVDAIFALMDGDTAAIGATFYGAYAPFRTAFTDRSAQTPDDQSATMPSSYMNLRLDLKYIKGLGADLIVHALVGGELMSVSIDENEQYTGSSYTNLRAGVGLIYQFGQLAELHLDAAVLPTLSAEVSGDEFGASDFGLGFNGGARLQLAFLEPINASIGYDLQYYSVNFASPNLAALGGQTVSTTDMIHVANAMVGYGF